MACVRRGPKGPRIRDRCVVPLLSVRPSISTDEPFPSIVLFSSSDRRTRHRGWSRAIEIEYYGRTSAAAKVDRLDNQDRLVYRLVVATADVWDPYAGALPPPPPPPHGDSLVLINDDDVTVV